MTTAHSTPDFAHQIAVNEYGFYSLPKAYMKREVPKVLSEGKVYEPETIRFMQRMCGSGDIIAGGAFVGDFFPALSSGVSKTAQIHSFEPNPTSFAAATHTLALNGIKNVKLHPVAVGAEAGTLPLLIEDAKGGANAAQTRIAGADDKGKTLDVDVKTLDELVPVKRKVSILQLDIEGHEVPALMGAKRIIQDCAPIVILEGPRPWKQEMFQNALDEICGGAAYQLTGVMERNAIFLKV